MNIIKKCFKFNFQINLKKMLAYIYQKTLWKYKTTNKEYHKFMINNIINQNKNSLIYSLYKSNITKKNFSNSYIYNLYNLYQSIKFLIKITESDNTNNNSFHPFLLNKFFRKFYLTNLKNQNKILVKRKSKLKRNNNIDDINDIKLENSLSSIKKTIDLDEKDNIQKGCIDFATDNEMLILLDNFQKKANVCLYNNYYNNINIYKKKKSPQVSFHVFSPKNKYIFRDNEFDENISKNNMVNNNIFINNNNYNNHTNYIINDFKDYKEMSNMNKNNYNFNDNYLNIEKKYHHFSNFKSQTKENLLSNRLTYRNRFSLPLSQSCEKFIYTKKYISSIVKQAKLCNKTSEEKENENENEENEVNDENKNNLNKIKVKYIPFINKNSNIKIIENNDKEDDVKIIKIEKLNYIGRNNNKINNKKKFPFLLSRITKNIKTNRKSNLTQEQFSSKFNSTFNMNYLTNFKNKPKINEKSKIEKSQSNYLQIKNINSNNNPNDNNNNHLQKIINKKDKKSIKRKESNLKFKKSNTAKTNFKNMNKSLRQNLFNIEKTSKKENKPKIKKENNTKIKKLTNTKFISPDINKDHMNHITSKHKILTKKISKKDLTNSKFSSDFPSIKKSYTNINLIDKLKKTNSNINTTKIDKKVLLNSKSNGNINTVSKQLFSPSKMETLKINKKNYYKNFNKELLILNSNYIEENNCFNTLPNHSINMNINGTNNEIKENTISPLKNNKDNLILNRITTKNNKKIQIPIKVNLNSKCFNESSYNKEFFNKHKKIINGSESFDSNKGLFSTTNRFGKDKHNLKKNSIKPIVKIIK